MAGGGIGEAALISAAIGGATSAATGGDPLKGALLGGLSGGMMSGIGGLFGGGASAAPELLAAEAASGGAPYASIMNNTGGISGLPAASSLGPSGLNPAFNMTPDLAGSAASNFTTPIGAAPMPAAPLYRPTPAAFSPTPEPAFGDKVGDFLKSGKTLGMGSMALAGAGAGLGEAMRAERERYKVPTPEKYNGPLSKLKYDPFAYTPYTYQSYAGGGPVEDMSNQNAVGANTGFPMANMHTAAYTTPYQIPVSQNVLSSTEEANVDPYTGQERLAGGGIASLGGYSDGGRLLRGPGDGVSDSIPATIADKQPARLADGEFVVPARIVSELGNGSTDAGAKQLYAMMDRVQSARRKTIGKGNMARNTRAAKYLPA